MAENQKGPVRFHKIIDIFYYPVSCPDSHILPFKAQIGLKPFTS